MFKNITIRITVPRNKVKLLDAETNDLTERNENNIWKTRNLTHKLYTTHKTNMPHMVWD